MPGLMAIFPIEIISRKQSYVLLYAFSLHIIYSYLMLSLINKLWSGSIDNIKAIIPEHYQFLTFLVFCAHERSMAENIK